MAKVLALMSQKGGSGKTTTAVHLGIAAHQAGLGVVFADLDPQRSLAKWHRRRKGQPPACEEIESADLRPLITRARRAKQDIVILDTAPHANHVAQVTMEVADFVLIPCQPSILDIDAIEATVQILANENKRRKGTRQAQLRAAVILSRCAPRRAVKVDDADGEEKREASIVGQARSRIGKVTGLPVAPGQITGLSAYSLALIRGEAVSEFDPNGSAAAEMRGIWEWVKQQIEGK